MLKKVFLTILLLSTSYILKSQTPSGERVLEVIGVANTKVMPDQGSIIIMIQTWGKDISGAVESMQARKALIEKKLKEIQFTINDIKTRSYSVNKMIVFREGENVDSGYVSDQTIEVEFANKLETIGRVIVKFKELKEDFQMRFEFHLSDNLKKKVNAELIDLAINDSKTKAEQIARSSGVQLGKIRNIEYGKFSESSMRELTPVLMSKSYEMVNDRAEGSFAEEGFVVKEIEMTDNVTIKWSIE